MQFILIPVGLMMIVTGIRDTHIQFGAQLRSDLTGPQNFMQYALALGLVGAAGYVDSLRSASNTFMALIIISMLLSNRGFFQRFSDALKQSPAPVAPSTADKNIAGTLQNGVSILGSQIIPPNTNKPAAPMVDLGAFGYLNWPSQMFGAGK